MLLSITFFNTIYKIYVKCFIYKPHSMIIFNGVIKLFIFIS
nr:MAG TPA: hypothetical protein [Caudoviricetes sp.]